MYNLLILVLRGLITVDEVTLKIVNTGNHPKVTPLIQSMYTAILRGLHTSDEVT